MTEAHVHDIPPEQGKVLHVTDDRVAVFYESWRHWRFAQHCPEHVVLRDMTEAVHKESA